MGLLGCRKHHNTHLVSMIYREEVYPTGKNGAFILYIQKKALLLQRNTG